ncbi:UNVERIFIED_CONTAM: hypothetical protein GTU68_046501 [Idotea baltica]|nr:hypothetical protein [Idotea baltica]
MTLRAVELLKSVDRILAEDTRTSGKLLKHFGIETRMSSYHVHNEHRITDQILEELKTGVDLALITDAGTPCISDPGFLIVRACHQAEVKVSCLPGANALVPALAMSGIPCDKFYFEGFLPQKKGRQTRWKTLAEFDCTVAYYESPHRLLKSLREMNEYIGTDTQVSVIKEVSKIYETVWHGRVDEVLLKIESLPTIKGEYVIVFQKKTK